MNRQDWKDEDGRAKVYARMDLLSTLERDVLRSALCDYIAEEEGGEADEDALDAASLLMERLERSTPQSETSSMLARFARYEKALREIIERAPDEEPEYAVWGDTEDAERWGIAAGEWEMANIARAALGQEGDDA